MPHGRLPLRLAAVAVLTAVAPPVLAATEPAPGGGGIGFGYGYGPHMMWWEGGWNTMFLGPFLMILIFAAIVVLAALALRAFGPARRDPAQHPMARRPSRALDILQERFARGEIDEAEYHARRKVLGNE